MQSDFKRNTGDERAGGFETVMEVRLIKVDSRWREKRDLYWWDALGTKLSTWPRLDSRFPCRVPFDIKINIEVCAVCVSLALHC